MSGLSYFATPLRHRDFRLLWLGQTVSSLGNFAFGVALPFQVFALGGEALELGLIFAISFAARILLLLPAGAYVDRISRRTIILVTDGVLGVLMTVLAMLGWASLLRLEHLYFAAAISAVATALQLPAMRAILPDLVPDDVLTQGNALRALSNQVGMLLGPLVGGLIVLGFGPPTALFVDGITFFISLLAFLASRKVPGVPASKGRLLTQIAEGLRFTSSVPWIWSTILSISLLNLFIFGPLTVGVPFLVRDVLGGDATALALISTSTAAGQLAGSALMGRMRFRRLIVWCYVACGVAGLGVGGLGVFPSFPFVLGFAGLAGLGIVIASALWNTALQRNVPRDRLGRVLSIDDLGGIFLAPAAPLAAGLLIQALGVSAVFVIGGLGTLAIAAAGMSLRQAWAVR